MKSVSTFFRNATAPFRWQYFSWKRMCLISIFMLIFFIGWRWAFNENNNEELVYPAILKLIGKAILMGFIFSFQKPVVAEEKDQYR